MSKNLTAFKDLAAFKAAWRGDEDAFRKAEEEWAARREEQAREAVEAAAHWAEREKWHLAKIEASKVSREEAARILDSALMGWTKKGYVVQARSETSAQLVLKHAFRKDKGVYLYVDERGMIHQAKHKVSGNE
jgi:CRISPR/Cas system-associated endonuclease/helicase Cas3